MSWEALRSSIDLLLRSPRKEVTLGFTGGEPLLEFPLIRRAVAYAEETRPRDKRVKYGLITNGLHLAGSASFLAEHDFYIMLSFDGVPEAQAYRGGDTFPVLDQLLDRLARDHPDFYHRNVTVCITLSPPTMTCLADSISYFLKKRVPEVTASPLIACRPEPLPVGGPAGCEAVRAEIDRQFARIYESSLRHFEETGEVPLLLFRKENGEDPDGSEGAEDGTMCAVARGTIAAVNPDGRVYGCTVLANDFQGLPSRELRRRLQDMELGHVGDPEFRARRAGFPDAARRAEIFHHKRLKHSSFGHCADCLYLADCVVCPLASAYLSGGTDPHRVDDFGCAFNLVFRKYRDQFPPRPSLRRLVAEGADIYRAITEGIGAAKS